MGARGRRLDPSEAFHAAAGWRAVHVVELDERLDDEVVEDAWRALQDSDPVLTCHVDLGDDGCFRLGDAAPSYPSGQADSVDDLVDRWWAPAATRRCAEVVRVGDAPGSTTLAVAVHHAVADGTGVATRVARLLGLIRMRVARGLLAPASGSRTLPRSAEEHFRWTAGDPVLPPNRDLVESLRVIAGLRDLLPMARPVHRTRAVTGRRLRRCREAAASASLSLNEVVAGCVLFAEHHARPEPSGPLGVGTSIDVRSWFTPAVAARAVTNFSFNTELEVRVSDPVDVARQYARGLAARVQECDPRSYYGDSAAFAGGRTQVVHAVVSHAHVGARDTTAPRIAVTAQQAWADRAFRGLPTHVVLESTTGVQVDSLLAEDEWDAERHARFDAAFEEAVATWTR